MFSEITPDADLLESLSSLHARCCRIGWSATTLQSLLAQGFGLYTKTEDLLTGFIVWQCAADTADLLTLAVHPEYRRQGIGHTLLYNSILSLRNNNMTTFFLEVSKENQAAISLYERLNFKVCGLRPNYYTEEGIQRDALTMSLSADQLVSFSNIPSKS